MKNKSVIVTAASKGLGQASAKQLAKEGAEVVISSSSQKNIEESYESVVSENSIDVDNVHRIKCDLSSHEDIKRLVEFTIDKCGKIDILVCNHGGPPSVTFSEATETMWNDSYGLVLKSTIMLINECKDHLQSSQAGNVIIVTSASAQEPPTGHAISNVYRLCLYGLAKSLAVEYAPKLRVNCIAPRMVMSDRIRYMVQKSANESGSSFNEQMEKSKGRLLTGRVGTPSEFGNILAMLASPKFDYVNGETICVDGGWTREVL